MITKNCPKCGNPMAPGSMRCSNCGSMTMRLGGGAERTISRRQALIFGIIILLFPICAIGAAGYRVYNDYLKPTETAAVAAVEEPSAPESEPAGEGADSAIEEPTSTAEPPTEEPAEVADEPSSDESSSGAAPSPTLPSSSSAACIPLGTERQVGTVVQVDEGDLIRVRIGDQDVNVRYLGIDAPLVDDAIGIDALAANLTLVFGKEVTLVRDVTDTDPEGNLMRYVLVGDTFVNHDLVSRGLAEATGSGPDEACRAQLQLAEDAAVTANAGMWEAALEPTNTLMPLWTSTPDPGSGKCDCAGGDDLDCGDFDTIFGFEAEAQACFEKCKDKGLGDYYNLDPDNDDLACN